MACGVLGEVMMLRLGAGTAAALKQPHTRAMDFTGRPMAGMLYVDPPGLKTAAQLKRWTKVAEAFVDGLPPRADKKPKPATKKPAARRR